MPFRLFQYFLLIKLPQKAINVETCCWVRTSYRLPFLMEAPSLQSTLVEGDHRHTLDPTYIPRLRQGHRSISWLAVVNWLLSTYIIWNENLYSTENEICGVKQCKLQSVPQHLLANSENIWLIIVLQYQSSHSCSYLRRPGLGTIYWTFATSIRLD